MRMTSRRLYLEFLTDEELTGIEETAYRLLDEVGLALQHARATEMLHGRGCRVAERVFIPRSTVEWALANLRNANIYRNRDGTAELILGDGQIRFHNSGGPPNVLDLETGQRRPATVRDCCDMARLLDALPGVDVVIPLFGPQDAPGELMSIAATEATLRNTTKPTVGGTAENPDEVRYKLELLAACCGGPAAFRSRPTGAVSVSPVSPLTFTEKVTGAMLKALEMGAPLRPLPAPSLGATAPITMAAALAQQHAEILASFVIAAAACPGAAVSYSSRISPLDMRTGTSTWGGPEIGMTAAAAAQLAHRIGFVCNAYGLSSSAGQLDPQFGYERFSNAMMAALGGVDILSGVGGMSSGLSGGFEVAAMDDELISVIKYIVNGCAVDEATLAFDVMKEVIPGERSFLGQMHTVRHMRAGALWGTRVSGRAAGGQEARDVVARARSRAQEILRTHTVEPLPDAVSRELTEIVERARRELVKA
jgi:trimethylamine--corrinoid protein Co-methyltransferase